jgi:hypothetical protein
MLPYIVVLMAVGYLVFHYMGIFDDIANFFSRFGQGSSGRSARSDQDKADQTTRLQVFEDFLGRGGENDDKPE